MTLDTRKAWGSREAASTLQSKEEMFRAPSRSSKGYPVLLKKLESQLPWALEQSEAGPQTALSKSQNAP